MFEPCFFASQYHNRHVFTVTSLKFPEAFQDNRVLYLLLTNTRISRFSTAKKPTSLVRYVSTYNFRLDFQQLILPLAPVLALLVRRLVLPHGQILVAAGHRIVGIALLDVPGDLGDLRGGERLVVVIDGRPAPPPLVGLLLLRLGALHDGGDVRQSRLHPVGGAVAVAAVVVPPGDLGQALDPQLLRRLQQGGQVALKRARAAAAPDWVPGYLRGPR